MCLILPSAETLHFLRTAAAILTWASKARQSETQFLLPDYKEIRGYLIEHSPHLLVIMLTFSLTVHILSPSPRQENCWFPDTDLPTSPERWLIIPSHHTLGIWLKRQKT